MGKLEELEPRQLSPEEAEVLNKERDEKETQKNQEASEEPNSSEEKETPEETKEPEKAEKSEEKDIKSALAQKEHFREKYEKAQKELEKYKSSGIQATDPLEVVKLAKALEGYSEEEIEFITRVAPEKTPSGIIEATKDEWVKDAIEKRREKVAKEKKVLESSSPSASKSGEISPEEAAKDDKKWFEYLKSLKEKKSSEL